MGWVYQRAGAVYMGVYHTGAGIPKSGCMYVFQLTHMGPLLLAPGGNPTTRMVGKQAVRILLECFLVQITVLFSILKINACPLSTTNSPTSLADPEFAKFVESALYNIPLNP